jgi:hypothetical protein
LDFFFFGLLLNMAGIVVRGIDKVVFWIGQSTLIVAWHGSISNRSVSRLFPFFASTEPSGKQRTVLVLVGPAFREVFAEPVTGRGGPFWRRKMTEALHAERHGVVGIITDEETV